MTMSAFDKIRVIAAGANKVPTGNISLRHIDNTPVYGYITSASGIIVSSLRDWLEVNE